MASYQEILTRGQQTVGIWQHFAPTLAFGTLTLAGQQADVAATPGADQTVVNAEAVIEVKRNARDASRRSRGNVTLGRRKIPRHRRGEAGRNRRSSADACLRGVTGCFFYGVSTTAFWSTSRVRCLAHRGRHSASLGPEFHRPDH